jgi:uncharacterized protein (TIGR03086 family)
MAITAVWDFPGRTPEQYEEVFRLGGAPIHAQPRRLSHVCYRTPTGIRVVDVWQDEESFAAFGAVLGPAVTTAGLDAAPEIFPVQGFMAVDGVRNPLTGNRPGRPGNEKETRTMDMLSAYADAVRRNHERLDAISADQLGDPTPCTEWDVRALVGHIVGGYQMFAAALGHPLPAAVEPTDAAGLAAQHRTTGEAAIAAFATPDALQRTVHLPVGEVPGQVALGLALTDAVVHGWDLAKATGQDTAIDDGLAAALLTGAEGSITGQMRQPDGAMPVFAQPVPISGQRPAGDRLVAFLGRQP